jgi:hypothetical protein
MGVLGSRVVEAPSVTASSVKEHAAVPTRSAVGQLE